MERVTWEDMERLPTSHHREADLERGYANGRAEQCVCGGVIVVRNGDDWDEIAGAVRLHNDGQRHRGWSEGW